MRERLLHVGAISRSQFSFVRTALVVVHVPALVILCLIGLQDETTVKLLTRDVNQYPNAYVYAGALSSIGILLWCGTASVCLFTFAVLRSRRAGADLTAFLASIAALTALLMLDDLFILHEVVLPQFLGLPEAMTVAAYGLVAVTVLLRFRAVILETDFVLLVLALFFFAVSVWFDALEATLGTFGHIPDGVGFLLEDGAKILGILSWLTYFARTCFSALREPI